jgi:hypothetical protein
MALDFDLGSVNQNENVCVIKVVYRFGEVINGIYVGTRDTVFLQDTLKVEDFPSNGNFDYFDFEAPNYYEYPSESYPSEVEEKMGIPYENGIKYKDSNGDNGIQFWVDWLREDTLCTLYIDYAEVYDNDGWNNYIEFPGLVATQITNYVQRYSDWDNIIYWYGQDEPWTIDAFSPMRIVDSLVQAAGGAPLITEFYPYWSFNNTINGDTLIRQFVELAKPEKLMIDVYPFGPDVSRLPIALESLRSKFQEAHSLQPNFWYVGQAYGWQLPDESWCVWRLPDSTELKASVMLALAHGVKGLILTKFVSEGPFTRLPCIDY